MMNLDYIAVYTPSLTLKNQYHLGDLKPFRSYQDTPYKLLFILAYANLLVFIWIV